MVGMTASGSLRAQEPGPEAPVLANLPGEAVEPLVTFSFVSKASGQPSWEIRLSGDQTGTYREAGSGAAAQTIHVGEAVWKRVQAALPAVRSGRCETRQKGIAQTGAKTFSVHSGRAPAACTFNYSDSDALNDAASAFIAVAVTMQEGAKLQHDHRFNKLSLDADMDDLLGEIANGMALEPGNVAGVLQSIVDDDHVIDRVRRKAARLLQSAADKPR